MNAVDQKVLPERIVIGIIAIAIIILIVKFFKNK
jgi:hypothetical protein